MKKVYSRNSYNSLDSQKSFFYIMIINALIGFIFSLILTLIARVFSTTTSVLTSSNIVKYISIIIIPICFATFYFIYNRKNGINVVKATGMDNKPNVIGILFAIILAGVCVFGLGPITNWILNGFESIGMKTSSMSYPMESWYQIILGIVGYAVLPAIFEELLLRGAIFNGFKQKLTAFACIFLTTACFTLMHGSLNQFFYQILLGIVLTWLMSITHNVIYPMITHFLNNLIVVILSITGGNYLVSGQYVGSVVGSIFISIGIFLVACAVVVLIMWLLTKKIKQDDTHSMLEVDGNNIIITNVEPIKKVGLKGYISSLTQTESFYFICSFTLAIVIWIFNTISLF